MPSDTAAFRAYAGEVRARIEAALERAVPQHSGCPAQLTEALRYSLLGGGKRLRPLLVILAAEACGGTEAQALPAGLAVEMIHTYSLVHDDLPAMDDDDLRRGRPTVHKVFGEALAILAGDALLTLAFEWLAREVQPPSVAAACVQVLAEAAGSHGMVGGQVDDTLREGSPSDLETLEFIHARKTGALLRSALRLGALVADATAAQTTALDTYGRALGLAFQITDDLLDVQGDEATVGKRVGKDSQLGKLTFPGLLGIEPSRRRARQLIDEACLALQPLGPRSQRLEALALYVLERDR